MSTTDLTGKKFGKWTALSPVHVQVNGKPRPAYACRCDCGTERNVFRLALIKSRSTQCRTCSNRQKAAMRPRLTHGMSETRLHGIWMQMRRRCTSIHCPDYPRYGGRGISVCPEWKDFAAFQQWAVQNGYAEHLTLDRRDNDRGYEPENCRWVGRVIQNRNRRNNQRYPFRGQMLMISEIAEITGQPLSMLRQRVQTYGWSIERATSAPAKSTWKTPTITGVAR